MQSKQGNPFVFRLDDFINGVTLTLQRNKQMKQGCVPNAVNQMSQVQNTIGNPWGLAMCLTGPNEHWTG